MTMPFTHSSKEAQLALHLSDSSLRKLRRAGVLKPGIHYRAVGAGTIKPMLLWDVAACEAALIERASDVLP